jgi:hypothetical protein
MEDLQSLRLECLKMAVSFYKNKHNDLAEVLFLADTFFKFIQGEVHV